MDEDKLEAMLRGELGVDMLDAAREIRALRAQCTAMLEECNSKHTAMLLWQDVAQKFEGELAEARGSRKELLDRLAELLAKEKPSG